MAYLDTDSAFAVPRGAARTEGASARFSPLEWSVILLARRDALGSLDTPGRMSRALGSVLGGGATSPLADPGLEALRRLAVRAWHRLRLPAGDIDRFFDAGFTRRQLATLVNSIAAAPAAKGTRP